MAIAKRAQYYIYCGNKPAYGYKIDIITIITDIADIIYITIIKIYIYNYAFLLQLWLFVYLLIACLPFKRKSLLYNVLNWSKLTQELIIKL